MSNSIPPAAVLDGDDVLLKQRVSDPDFWLSVAAWTVIAWSTLQVVLFSFGRDQSIYAQVADTMLHGGVPYRDSWDFKPPGIFVIYALAQALFGKSMVAPRLLEALGMIAMVLSFRRFTFETLGKRLPGHLGGALACLVHAQLEFWHTGQPESFGGFLTAIALMLSVRKWVKWRGPLAWLAVGALFGMAFLLKPPLGGGAAVCAAYLVRRELAEEKTWLVAQRPLVFLTVAAALLIGLCFGWFWLVGAWSALDWTLFKFTPGYTAVSWGTMSAPEAYYRAFSDAFTGYSSLCVTGILAAIAIRPLHSREREGLFLLFGVASIHLAGIAMQGKYFAYHYGATLHLLALAAGVGFYKLWRRTLMSGAGGVLAFAAFVYVIGGMRIAMRGDLLWPAPRPHFWGRSERRLSHLFGRINRVELDQALYYVADYNLYDNRRAADEVARLAPVDAPIFVWGFEPSIYWLSDRKPSTRFIYNVAQRASWKREEARKWLLEDLAQRPPAVIVVQSWDQMGAVTGNNRDSRAELAHFPELRALIDDHYLLETNLERFLIYRRKGAP